MKTIKILLFFFLSLIAGLSLSATVYKSKSVNKKFFFRSFSKSAPKYPRYFWIKLHHVDEYLIKSFKVKRWINLLRNLNHPLRDTRKKIVSKKKYLGDLYGKEITSLFKKGVKYSYVITDEWLIIANIIPESRKRYSKHLVISNFLKYVRYAGELSLHEKYRDSIILDNNSGTYKPSKKYLKDVAALINEQLGVETYTKEYNAHFKKSF